MEPAPPAPPDTPVDPAKLAIATAGFDAFARAIDARTDAGDLVTFDMLDAVESHAWLEAFDAALAKGMEPTTPMPTEAHAAAWHTYWSDPDVELAQRRFTDRENELAPLRTFYRNEITAARLLHQQTVHTQMMQLTRTLATLDHGAPPATFGLPRGTGTPPRA